MIGLLQGTLYFKSDRDIIILTRDGVGYRVEATSGLSGHLEGETITAYIYTHVREDAIKLFGFVSEDELKVFELLISVSGVGPKGAMNIVSMLGSEGVYQAIIHEDAKAFKGVSGIGAKNAEKIIIELKGKIGKEDRARVAGLPSPVPGKMEELETALTSLGYTSAEVRRVAPEIKVSDNLSEMVREGLKLLNR